MMSSADEIATKACHVHACAAPTGPMRRAAYGLRIIIPAHNEEHRIEPTVRDYCSHFGERAVIIVVANACNDNSVRTLRQLCAEYRNLELLDISASIGKGGAIRAGFKFGDESYVGFTDADHSTSAREFDRLFQACIASSSCGVIASRWRAGSIILRRQPPERRIASRTFNAVVKLLFGLPFADTQCGAKIFKRSAIEGAISTLELADFAFDIDLLTNLRSRRCRVLELPTVWSDSIQGTTVQRLGRTAASMLWGILRLRLRRSIFGSIPYLAWMARDSVIPVRDRLALLVLTHESQFYTSPQGEYIVNATRHWEKKGHTVTLIAETRAWRRLAVLAWYVGLSRRRYDAVVEVRGGAVPFVIPSFSAKPTYLIESATSSGREQGWQTILYRLLYRNVARVRVCGDEVSPATLIKRRAGHMGASRLNDYDDILRHIAVNGAYRAAFMQEDGSWHLTFRNPVTHVLSRQKIAPERATL